MNRPGDRIGACFGKAALKTHALQTLRDLRASPNRAKRLECVRFIGAFLPAGRKETDRTTFGAPESRHSAQCFTGKSDNSPRKESSIRWTPEPRSGASECPDAVCRH